MDSVKVQELLEVLTEYIEHFEGCDTCEEKGICGVSYNLLVDLDNRRQGILEDEKQS